MHIFICMMFIIYRDKERLNSEIMDFGDYVCIYTHISEYLQYIHMIIYQYVFLLQNMFLGKNYMPIIFWTLDVTRVKEKLTTTTKAVLE